MTPVAWGSRPCIQARRPTAACGMVGTPMLRTNYAALRCIPDLSASVRFASA